MDLPALPNRRGGRRHRGQRLPRVAAGLAACLFAGLILFQAGYVNRITGRERERAASVEDLPPQELPDGVELLEEDGVPVGGEVGQEGVLDRATGRYYGQEQELPDPAAERPRDEDAYRAGSEGRGRSVPLRGESHRGGGSGGGGRGGRGVDFLPGDGTLGAMEDPALVVIAYNRADYLQQTLASLARVARLRDVHVYVSQDGHDNKVRQVAEAAGTEGPFGGDLAPPHTRGFTHMERERVPLLGNRQPGHAWLAQHYRWALDQVFIEHGHSHAIICEDDMIFSEDFIHFFQVMAPLLEMDPTLWCVSSWNDNGLKDLATDPYRVSRTSYFPGLGWMMRRELWLELGPHFPKENWDHWMRLDTVAKGRDCIVPEMNRNYNIGAKGVNIQQSTYDKFFAGMSLNHQAVRDYGDLSPLLQPRFSRDVEELVRRATPFDWKARDVSAARDGVVLVTYVAEEYKKLAARFGIWPDPRGHHKHLAQVRRGATTFLLADARFCPFLPPHLKLDALPGLRATRANRNEDCNAACGRGGLQCRVDQFWYINSCGVLMQHYPCERGCAIVLGPDIPNYVMEPSLSTYGQCLVTQEAPTCGARHSATARLCACV